MPKLYIDIHFPVEYEYISDPFNLRQSLPCLMQPDNFSLKLRSDKYVFTFIYIHTGTHVHFLSIFLHGTRFGPVKCFQSNAVRDVAEGLKR